ncbi:hypothetical protein A6R68_17529, partial [Neotoma lepida]
KITQEQEMEKNNVKCASSWSRPSLKRDEVTIGQQIALQYKHYKNYIRENEMEMVGDEFEKSELIIHPKEGPPPDDSRRAISTKKRSQGISMNPILTLLSIELLHCRLLHMLNQLLLPALVMQVTWVTWTNKAFKAELAFLVALAVCTEHQRWQPHTDPELAPGHRTGNTGNPPHNADLALDKLSIDPESAPLCGPSDTEDQMLT